MFKNLIVAKFGGTSVADFHAMNRSADVVLSNPNVRLVVLSASAGVTNLLFSLAEGQPQEQRAYLLDEIRRIQYAIIDSLNQPAVIREEIDRLLDNITMLSEAAALATSTALTDELVSHGELMSTLLFVEILRQREAAAEWFDVRKVMRTDDRFGRAAPEVTTLAELASAQLQLRIAEALIVSGLYRQRREGPHHHAGPRRQRPYRRALLGEALNAARIDIWTDVPGIYTTDPRVVLAAKRMDVITFEEAAEMATFGDKVLHPAPLLPAVSREIPVFVGSSRTRLWAALSSATKPRTRRCSARWLCAASRHC